MASVSDALRPSAAAAAQGVVAAAPSALPRIWTDGAEARDSFRSLVPALLRLDPAASVVGLCSTLQGEGTTTITAGLACALAEARAKVVIIDAHGARPGHTSDLWGDLLAAPKPGESLLDTVRITSAGLPADGGVAARLRRRIVESRPDGRVVLLDLAPLKESSDALALAGCVDAVYLVVEAERERREVIARSVQTLARAGLPVAGVLLNKRPRRIPDFLYRWL